MRGVILWNFEAASFEARTQAVHWEGVKKKRDRENAIVIDRARRTRTGLNNNRVRAVMALPVVRQTEETNQSIVNLQIERGTHAINRRALLRFRAIRKLFIAGVRD